MFEHIGLILFGYLLGQFGQVAVDWIKARGRRREFAVALLNELQELKIRATAIGIALRQRRGTLDKEFLEWVRPILKGYKGSEPIAIYVSVVDSLRDADPQKLDRFNQASIGPEDGLRFKTLRLSYFDANVDQVATLNNRTQRAIHELRNELHVFNQEVPYAREAQNLTLSRDGDETHHARVSTALGQADQILGDSAERMVHKILRVESELERYLPGGKTAGVAVA